MRQNELIELRFNVARQSINQFILR